MATSLEREKRKSVAAEGKQGVVKWREKCLDAGGEEICVTLTKNSCDRGKKKRQGSEIERVPISLQKRLEARLPENKSERKNRPREEKRSGERCALGSGLEISGRGKNKLGEGAKGLVAISCGGPI